MQAVMYYYKFFLSFRENEKETKLRTKPHMQQETENSYATSNTINPIRKRDLSHLDQKLLSNHEQKTLQNQNGKMFLFAFKKLKH